MKLKNLSQPNSLTYLERWANLPKYSTTAQYSEVDRRYHPRFGEPTFSLPSFFLTKKQVDIFYAKPDKKLVKKIIKDNRVTFFVHPNSLSEFLDCPAFNKPQKTMVIPTSSTRTVATIGQDKDFMIKLHLNRKVSRFIRRLTLPSIIHSILVSRECEKIVKAPDCPKEFAFLPESIGISHKRKKIGFVIRELTPRPTVLDKRYLVPFFALYSPDQKNKKDQPLLAQLIAEQSLDGPLDFFIKNIMDPFIKCWAYVFLNFGLLLEAHGQNTLLELDQNYQPRRIIHRDLQSTPIDPVIRKRRGLAMPFEKHIIGTGDYPRLIEHSLLYDHFVSDYLFESLAEFFEKYYQIEKSVFFIAVKKVFRKYIKTEEEKEFFPQGHVVFSDQIRNNTCPLLYLHEKPTSRPSY